MLLMYAREAERPQMTPEEQQVYTQAWYAFTAEAKAAGVWMANDGLCPTADATTVQVRDGKTLITDGPFAETHEQLGGYYLVNCKDLDEAVGWAAKIPGAKYGSVEVRPLNVRSQKQAAKTGHENKRK